MYEPELYARPSVLGKWSVHPLEFLTIEEAQRKNTGLGYVYLITTVLPSQITITCAPTDATELADPPHVGKGSQFCGTFVQVENYTGSIEPDWAVVHQVRGLVGGRLTPHG